MKLIAIFLCLWADRRFPDYVDLRHFSLYNMLVKIVLKLGVGGENQWIPYLLLTVLPAGVLMMTISVLSIISPIEMLLWAVALYLCLPSEPLSERVRDYLAASRAESGAEVDKLAESLLEATPPDSDSERDREISLKIFSSASVHIVSLFFWFSVGGIGGALFYRFNWQLATGGSGPIREQNSLAPMVLQALGLLTWIPARLLGLAYGINGKFSPAFSRLFARSDKTQSRLENNFAVASSAGFAAAGFDETTLCDEEHVESSWSLVKRANIVLLIALALITVYRWF